MSPPKPPSKPPPKVPPKTPPGTPGVPLPGQPPVAALLEGVAELCKVWMDYRKTETQEQTARARIDADLRTRLASIDGQLALMQQALADSTELRKLGLEAQIRALDQAMAQRDPALVQTVVTGLVHTLEASPLKDMAALHRQLSEGDEGFVLRL